MSADLTTASAEQASPGTSRTTSNISTVFAYITDITPPEKRARQFGLIGAAFGLGFVIGPAIGGFLGQHNLRLPFWFAAGCSLINFTYGCLCAAGVAGGGKAAQVRMAHGQCARLA